VSDQWTENADVTSVDAADPEVDDTPVQEVDAAVAADAGDGPGEPVADPDPAITDESAGDEFAADESATAADESATAADESATAEPVDEALVADEAGAEDDEADADADDDVVEADYEIVEEPETTYIARRGVDGQRPMMSRCLIQRGAGGTVRPVRLYSIWCVIGNRETVGSDRTNSQARDKTWGDDD
jgi:hypothetical protein